MRRGSVVGPLILIAIGALFLVNNLNPDLSVLGILARSWPFLLIAWGALRLIEIVFWAVRGKPLPVAGISGGEWVLIIFVSLIGSGLFFVHERSHWQPFHIKMRGIEVFGEAFDYPIAEQRVSAGKAPRVVLENPRGNARVIGADEEEVTFSGRKTVRAMNREQADGAANAVVFEVVREGETVFIRPKQQGWRNDEFLTTDLEVRVPKGARVECHGRRGDFDVTNIAGDVSIESDNAGVRVESIGGKLRVETRASDIIRASGVKGTVEVKGYGQDVELENIEDQVMVSGNYFGDLQFRNISKPVRFEGGIKSRTAEMRVEAVPGQIQLDRGKMILEQVVGPVVITAKSKDIELSGFTESLELRLDRGDVELRPGRSEVPKMDVLTSSGNIELSLPENAKFALKATARRGGDVENDFGDVLKAVDNGQGRTLTGQVGDGPRIALVTERGSVQIRKGSAADFDRPLTPLPPRPPRVDSLRVERN